MLTYFLAGFVCLGLVYLVATRSRRSAPVEAEARPDQRIRLPARLVVRLPEDRNRYGAIDLRDKAGHVLEGPFAVIGRAADALAARGGNPERLATRPFGDTPLGRYRIVRIELAPTQLTQLGSFGPHGRIILGPLGGEAALAEAAGRFEIALQGGRLGPDGGLRATDGGLRVHDLAIWTLLNALRHSIGLDCEILPGKADAVLDGGDDDDGVGLVYFSEDWDPAWPDPTLSADDFAADVGPDLTGTHAFGQGEQMREAAAIGGAAAAGAGEFLAGGDNAYAP